MKICFLVLFFFSIFSFHSFFNYKVKSYFKYSVLLSIIILVQTLCCFFYYEMWLFLITFFCVTFQENFDYRAEIVHHVSFYLVFTSLLQYYKGTCIHRETLFVIIFSHLDYRAHNNSFHILTEIFKFKKIASTRYTSIWKQYKTPFSASML